MVSVQRGRANSFTNASTNSTDTLLNDLRQKAPNKHTNRASRQSIYSMKHFFAPARFLRHALQGYWFTPWRSPYLRWRMETFSGIPAEQLSARAFWKFMASEKGNLLRFLRWTSEIEQYAQPQAKKAAAPGR